MSINYIVKLNARPMVTVKSTRGRILHDIVDVVVHAGNKMYSYETSIARQKIILGNLLSSSVIQHNTVLIFQTVYTNFLKHCFYYITPVPMFIGSIEVRSMIS